MAASPIITEKPASHFVQINFGNPRCITETAPDRTNPGRRRRKFEPEGDNCDAVLITKAFKTGWAEFIVYK